MVYIIYLYNFKLTLFCEKNRGAAFLIKIKNPIDNIRLNRVAFSLLFVLAVVCISATLFVNNGEEVMAAEPTYDYEDDQGVRYKIDGVNANVFGYDPNKIPAHVEIPSNVTIKSVQYDVIVIDDEAFKSCKSFTSISMNSVETIGKNAFRDCESLVSIFMDGVTKIGTSAFMRCESLVSASMNSATTIGSSAFYGCKSLVSASVDSVETVGMQAFNYCESLTSITMPDCTQILGYAFMDCTNLASITIPNNLTIIELQAFDDCPSLTTLTISGKGKGNMNMLNGFKEAPWKLNGYGEIKTLNIDTPDPIDIKDVMIIEGNVLNITSISTNVTGPAGKMFLGTKMLSDEEISGMDFVGTKIGTEMVWKHYVYSLSLKADQPSYGEVTGSGVYEYDSFVRISAIPNEGYSFVSWSDGNTDAERTIKITTDIALTAYFVKEDPVMCTITIIIEGKGHVYGMGIFEKGTVVTLNAVPGDGYSFQGWSHTTYKGVTVSVSVESNMVIKATFSQTDTGIGGSSGSLIDTATVVIIILIILIVFGSIIVISLVRGRRSV